MKPTTKKAVKKIVPEKAKYTLEAHLNNQVFMSEGEGMEVFSRLQKPPKYVTKGIFILTNNKTGKTFQIVYPPFLSRKLLASPIVQSIQWRRMAGKVD